MDPPFNPARHPPPPPWLRYAVRDILGQSAGFQALDADQQRSLANAMVRVSAMAANLIGEEADAQAAIDRQHAPRPLASAQAAADFGAAADRIAGTTRNVLNAVSFPRFVTDLINGVFRAMLDSNAQQMNMYVQLLNNVSASLDGFANTQFSLDSTRRWLAEHFPGQLELEQPEIEPGEPPPDPEDVEPPRLRLAAGASMPGEEELRTVLGLQPGDPLEASSPEQLVPLARRQMARQRQQMLATMVMLGMQRIVVESGRISAGMRFHIDTRSAASEQSGNTFNMQNRVKAAGSFGLGPWGASAEIENTIGYVSTQRNQSTEEMNTDLELNSSVELNFRSDYIPLNRMAAQAYADRIRANSLNPDVEMAKAEADERRQREASQRQAETERNRSMDDLLSKPSAPQTPGTPAKPPAATPPATGGASGAGGNPPAAGNRPSGQNQTAAGGSPATGTPATPPASHPPSSASPPPSSTSSPASTPAQPPASRPSAAGLGLN